MKKSKSERGSAKADKGTIRKPRASRRRTRKRVPATLSTPVNESKLHTMTIADFYKPLKKPVTLRLDADVIAWFKKDGRRYQTRINAALRSAMQREAKKSG
jgi:uncharacterized protein (DUF4415 family)